jgi:hypothetical protein
VEVTTIKNLEDTMLDFIKQILTDNTDAETGKVDIDAVMNAVNKTAPEYVVPKEQYNKQADQLKDAKTTLDSVQKSNKDNADLQKEVDEWRTKFEAEVKTNAVDNALRDAGAKDLDYMKYKLGEIELNKDGTVKDLDNKIKVLKEGNADWFNSAESNPATQPPANGQQQQTQAGYTVFDNSLPTGTTPTERDNVTAAFSEALGLK